MKLSNSTPISSDSVLARMAPEMASTFSPAQIQALQAALTPRRHAVNIRLSLPLGLTRVYLVLLAGTEVRSTARRRQEAAQHPLWTPINMLVIVGTMGMGIFALLVMAQITSNDLSAIFNPKAAPAGIPFKSDRASCEESGRTWQENECLDFGHDPTF